MLIVTFTSSVNATEMALNHSNKTHESVTDMGKEHVSAIEELVR